MSATRTLMYDSRQHCAPPYDNVHDATSAARLLNRQSDKRNVLLEGVTTDEGEEEAGGSTSRPENDDYSYRLQQPEKRQLWSGGHSGSGSQRRRLAVHQRQADDPQAEDDRAAERGIAGGGQAAAKVNPPSPPVVPPAANMSTKSMGGGGVGGRTGSNNNNNNNSNAAGSSALADDSQQYCLRWNNHRSNLLTVFEQLLQTEAFTDVTLAVGGTSIKCHKMVLAACSSYFQSLFLENACPHPIVVFKDIQYAEIRAILEYMYRGEVNVAQEQLPSLLKVAEALRVKGLFEDDSLNASSSGGDRETPYQAPASSGLLSSTSVNVTPGGGGVVGPSSHGGSSSGSPPSTSINAHPPIIRSTSGHALSGHHLPVSSSSNADRSTPSHRYADRASGGSADHNHHHNHHHHLHNRNKSPSPTSPPERSGGHIRGDPESGAGSYSRHASSSYLYKSPMLSPQGSEQGGDRRDGSATRGDRDSAGSAGNPLSMWPPLVMPLHLGAFETALREREQALALYGAIQRGGSNASADDREPSSGNGRNSDHHFDRHGDNNGGGGASKRKRLSIASADSDQTPSLLRTVLGPHHGSSKHHHHADIPGLFPFRLSAAAAAAAAEGSGSADDRNHLSSYLPMAMAYAERQAGRDRDRGDDDWNQNPDLNSEDDPSEISGEYGHPVPSSPLSDKRVDASGARIAAYVPTQKLEWKRYKQYTNSDITAAIEAVKSGMSALQASRKFKVPSRTLYDKVKKLGIATTRPYSRVSSSTSSSAAAAASAAANSAAAQAAAAAAAAAMNAANQNNFAASTAALTSAMAAAALSLVKRERGPVIQVAGSSRHEAAAVVAATNSAGQEDLPESCGPADYSEDSRQESPENLTIGSSNLSTSSPGSHGSAAAPTPSSNGKDIKKETPDSTPTPPPAPQTPPPRQSSKFSAGARVGGAYFAVRDDLNSTTSSIAEVVMDDRGGSASPNPSTT
ncbi:LOW QUALITY PROTEIN: broad-complex core protein isoforms 1/2/3/4/5-like [Daphnia carinata]|uniref:LOW QUALITY PROTEIN: broad-complex core protein isoforms 1/2/3/4/5-like n=1 Tax=Daphnia carinata TaxID=120202 RepID=UPI00257BAE15|nr:LOW QUALITY PROTEIN: broad-complex core protein isoforms 1/2/3/4/5-like [Daphnia carinata]